MNNFIIKNRFFITFSLTAFIVAFSLLFSFAVRFDFAMPQVYWQRFYSLMPAVLIIKLGVIWFFGGFSGWWRYVSMPDLIQIVKANIIGSLLFIAYVMLVYRMDLVPRSVLLLDGIFCFLFTGGIRFITRAIREASPRLRQTVVTRKPVLIVGAGDAGHTIAREIRLNPKLGFELVGFVDDDLVKSRTTFQGLMVLGTLDDLEVLIKKHDVEEVIIAIPSATGKQIRSVVDRCQNVHCRFKVLPGVSELINGRASLQQIRDVNLDDLLGREPVSLDTQKIKNLIQGKRVLVTGAGGSIGSELCRQIVRFNPSKLILFENAETPLFLIEQELGESVSSIPIVPVIGDVRNRSRVNVIFDQQMPEVVFHVAAYKHVPLMESNPAEAVNNNVQGTRLLADAADAFGVEKFILVSTDKAVKPANVMGATKRIAEMYVQSLNQSSKTRFITTRFGNVLGSNGSVIPTFKNQIAHGGPVTVTHPEVTRYFMTISEASQLVLQAGSMGRGGEIYLFDMGEPVKIKKLAEELIRLSGLKPYDDIDLVYIGLRPGEKLYEELLLEVEGVLPSPHKKIHIAQAATPTYDLLAKQIDSLLACAKALDILGVMEWLVNIVPEYKYMNEEIAATSGVNNRKK